MKKSILLTTAFALFGISAFCQTKQPKTYTLQIVVDSAGYAKAQELLSKSYTCLDASSAPHHDVNESMAFIKQLSELWQREKVEQDKVKEVKK